MNEYDGEKTGFAEPDQAVAEFELESGAGRRPVYGVAVEFEIDEDTRQHLEYCFNKPSMASYDRYVKSMSKSPTKASKAFVTDNVVEAQRVQLLADLEKYPAISITISDKLFGMLGLGDATVKKL